MKTAGNGVFEGYTAFRPHDDGIHMVVVRTKDFGHPQCSHAAFDVRTKLPFKGIAQQAYLITRNEGAVLHQGD